MRTSPLNRPRLTLATCGALTAALAVTLIPMQHSDAAAPRPITYRTSTPGPVELPTSSVSEWPAALVIGKTARGRNIVARRQGNPNAQRVILAIGVIHGNEPAGARIVRTVNARQISPNAGYQLWTVPFMNPDGFVARQRHNVRGVDLNRNFPYSWSRYTYAAGQAPGSEAETQTMVNFMDRLRPDASLIFHQDWNQVLGTCNSKTRPRAYRYAALAGIPPERCFRAYTGTMGSWYNYLYPGYALTVELPSTRRITPLRINRFAGSVIRLAQETPNFDPTSVLPDTPAPDPSESSEPPAAD